MQWTKADGFAAGSSDCDYYLYAKDGSSLYMVYLDASSREFDQLNWSTTFTSSGWR
jgi:hypothetical protein